MSGAEGDLKRNIGAGVSVHSECLDMLATQSKHNGSNSSGLVNMGSSMIGSSEILLKRVTCVLIVALILKHRLDICIRDRKGGPDKQLLVHFVWLVAQTLILGID